MGCFITKKLPSRLLLEDLSRGWTDMGRRLDTAPTEQTTIAILGGGESKGIEGALGRNS